MATTKANGTSSRPYKLTEVAKDKEKKPMVGCYYSDITRALDGACRRVQWLSVMWTIEVTNRDSDRLIGTYTKSAAGEIKFWRNTNG